MKASKFIKQLISTMALVGDFDIDPSLLPGKVPSPPELAKEQLRPIAPPPAPKAIYKKPLKIVLEMPRGEMFEGQELYSMLAKVIECSYADKDNPNKNEYEVTKAFQVTLKEGE